MDNGSFSRGRSAHSRIRDVRRQFRENLLWAKPCYCPAEAQLFYWRTRSGVEVDFVVYGASTFRAIEVKNTARVRPEDLRGLETFIKDYPQAEAALLYRGARRERQGRIWILPVADFLRALDPAKDLTFEYAQ